MPVLPGAEPFSHSGSTEVGVLLCHGFTGSPNSLRPWGAHLANAGFTVRAPRLPGHGTTWQEMNRTRWTDWYDRVRDEFLTLKNDCSSVVVCGQSMGGTLTLCLAQEFGADISGLVLVNPSITTLRWDAKFLPLVSRIVPSIAGLGGDIAKPGGQELAYPRVPLKAAASLSRLWKLVRANLAQVDQPVLLLHSSIDHVVEPVNSRIILDGISSVDVTEIELKNSFHVATLDNDAPLVFDYSVEFIQRLTQKSKPNAH